MPGLNLTVLTAVEAFFPEQSQYFGLNGTSLDIKHKTALVGIIDNHSGVSLTKDNDNLWEYNILPKLEGTPNTVLKEKASEKSDANLCPRDTQ